jgi:hypothetical protein
MAAARVEAQQNAQAVSFVLDTHALLSISFHIHILCFNCTWCVHSQIMLAGVKCGMRISEVRPGVARYARQMPARWPLLLQGMS